jgi:hypothetical protein
MKRSEKTNRKVNKIKGYEGIFSCSIRDSCRKILLNTVSGKTTMYAQNQNLGKPNNIAIIESSKAKGPKQESKSAKVTYV